MSEQPDRPHCRDPFDRAFLELALAGGADALITGDDALLSLAPAFPVPILSPDAARDVVGGGPRRV